MKKKRVIINIKGRVQGVGFRYFVLRQAQLIGIQGTVKNCMDGSVEVDAEGDPDSLELFIMECKKGPRMARVDMASLKEMPVYNFITFKIK